MRRLASVHEIRNSKTDLWSRTTGFVAYFIYFGLDSPIQEYMREHWEDVNHLTGRPLFVVVTDIDPTKHSKLDENDFKAERARQSIKLLDQFDLSPDDTPVMIFPEGRESENYFVFHFPTDKKEMNHSMKVIIGAARRYSRSDASQSDKFAFFTQHIRAHSHRRVALKVLKNIPGGTLIDILFKIFGR